MTQLIKPCSPNRKTRFTYRASVLLITLWSLFLLSMFSVILAGLVRQNLLVIRWLDERLKARHIAQAGIYRAIVEIMQTAQLSVHGLSQSWANSEDIFKDVALGDGTFSVSYSLRDPLSAKNITYYGCVDEESKVNINKASIDVLERLIRVLGVDPTEAKDIAASIVDWRDKDSLLSSTGSAEDYYYKTLSTSYEAKDGPFECLEELLVVKGIDEKLFEQLKNYITIYGTGKININTASPTVLFALGATDTLVEKILLLRYGKDGVLGTNDDYLFEDAANLVSVISSYFNLSDSDTDYKALVQITKQTEFCVKSTHFSINSVANIRRREVMRISAVVNLHGAIVSWKES